MDLIFPHPNITPTKLSEVASADCCKLCNSPEPLHPCSHVIPQWMYEMLPMDNRRMRIASSHQGEWEQRSLTGIYGTFVCRKCEDRFATWDGYAAAVLRRQPTATTQGWDFGQYDYARLKRFFLSIMWRIHACEKFFEEVDLGSYVNPLAKCLLNDDTNALRDFEVVPTWCPHLLALDETEPGWLYSYGGMAPIKVQIKSIPCWVNSHGVMTPVRVMIESVPYWQLYLPLFQALIKVEPGPGAPCLQPFVMAEKSSLCMLEKTFTEFGEAKTGEHVVTENQKKKNAKRQDP
ncbi:MAG: hypothetical protein KJ950_00070 [Proteobacteria bacterium]|nr:hypothetical protein [Pseudomonadota bacterium]MBU1688697.1 hypothetical protein [Pseudomonadota bacterium]